MHLYGCTTEPTHFSQALHLPPKKARMGHLTAAACEVLLLCLREIMAAFASFFHQTAAVSVCHPVANITLLTTKYVSSKPC